MTEEVNEQNIEREWTIEIHGVIFEVIMSITEELLTIDIEQIETGERWSGKFTSQFLEEITHQAGNFKKYNVFVKMLITAFSQESKNVYVDLLTFNDLQNLRARKLGMSSSFTSQSSQSQSNSKRYIILSYESEFDRVNFPLSLAYEETPNVFALQKTIRRLRHRLKEAQTIPATSKERELKIIDSNLRQENTELKFRLRQLESRVGNSTPSSSSLIATTPTSGMDTSSHNKYKKQIEALKKELSDLSVAYERLKIESSREISKWRSNVPQTSNGSNNDDFKRKYLTLQHILETERIDHRREINHLLKELKDAKQHNSYRRRTNSTSPSRTRNVKKQSHQIISSNRLTSGLSSTSDYKQRSSLSSSSRANRQTSRSPDIRLSRKDLGNRKDYSTARSPTYASLSRSRSPSSSLGGRFDPTAYALDRAKRAEASRKSRGLNSRYHESGYSSANSQSSNGSRKSVRSNSSIGSRSSTRSHSSYDKSNNHYDLKESSKSKKKKDKKRESKKKDGKDIFRESYFTPEYEALMKTSEYNKSNSNSRTHEKWEDDTFLLLEQENGKFSQKINGSDLSRNNYHSWNINNNNNNNTNNNNNNINNHSKLPLHPKQPQQQQQQQQLRDNHNIEDNNNNNNNIQVNSIQPQIRNHFDESSSDEHSDTDMIYPSQVIVQKDDRKIEKQPKQSFIRSEKDNHNDSNEDNDDDDDTNNDDDNNDNNYNYFNNNNSNNNNNNNNNKRNTFEVKSNNFLNQGNNKNESLPRNIITPTNKISQNDNNDNDNNNNDDNNNVINKDSIKVQPDLEQRIEKLQRFLVKVKGKTNQNED